LAKRFTTESDGVKTGLPTILVHVDTRTHALLTVPTNICWKRCKAKIPERELLSLQGLRNPK